MRLRQEHWQGPAGMRKDVQRFMSLQAHQAGICTGCAGAVLHHSKLDPRLASESLPPPTAAIPVHTGAAASVGFT